jgi:phage host-nuclease inhibitor protein Gam
LEVFAVSTIAEDIEQVSSRANELMGELGDAVRKYDRLQQNLDEEVKRLTEEHSEGVDRSAKHVEELKQQLIELVMPHFNLLARAGTKTIFLRNGEVALSQGQESVVNVEGASDDQVVEEIRKHRGINKYTRLGRRVPNREALKKSPEFVAKLKLVFIERKPTVRLRPARMQGETLKRQQTRLTIYLKNKD